MFVQYVKNWSVKTISCGFTEGYRPDFLLPRCSDFLQSLLVMVVAFERYELKLKIMFNNVQSVTILYIDIEQKTAFLYPCIIRMHNYMCHFWLPV